MSYIPIAPFGRTLDAGLIEHHQETLQDVSDRVVNKYDLMRQLTLARDEIGVSPKALAVLQALLSFHPKAELKTQVGGLIVYPSNASICTRMNGIACSTMRRHLSQLVELGLIVRRDSPNGKRFVKRSGSAPSQAFGFDLAPLISRYPAICDLAQKAEAEKEAYDRLRRTLSLMRRDLAALAAYGTENHPKLAIWDGFSQQAVVAGMALKRKLGMDEMRTLRMSLNGALEKISQALDTELLAKLSTNNAHNEHHQQKSNKEKEITQTPRNKPEDYSTNILENSIDKSIPVCVVLEGCKTLQELTGEPLSSWDQFRCAVERIRPMTGISSHIWQEAKNRVGTNRAGMLLSVLLDRFEQINKPEAYFATMISKAEDSRLSCITATLNRRSEHLNQNSSQL